MATTYPREPNGERNRKFATDRVRRDRLPYAMGMRHLLLLPLLTSCTFFRPAAVPMPVLEHPCPAGDARGLVVLLPGRGDVPGAYERHGFVDRIQEVNPRLDVLSVDAHLGYFRNRSITERLHQDVFAPRAEHYEHIWVVGISMGGLGAIAYDIEHPGVLDGMLLLAPYLGDAEVVREVQAAGGPPHWQPTDAESDTASALYRRVWRWCRELHLQPRTKPTVLVGYGDGDRFRDADAMLAAALPARRRLVLPGRHDWRTWSALFAALAPRAFREL